MNSQSAHTETTPFLFARTKLRPPRLRSDTLPRPRLVETIRRSIANARLALVSAPAGYGKTTLVANAVSDLPNTRIVWLTVDREDDEPLRFFSAFAAALEPIAPEFASLTTGILAAGGMSGQRDPLSSGRAVMTALVNELFENEQPLCLILDDLHYVVHETIHSALNFLIERLPPHVTLIVTTRHDPPLALAQLRARRELVELRLEELRFTSDEMAALLNQHFGLALTTAELEALMRRTEGWAAGMALISASLQRIQTASARSTFFEQIANSNRYLFDYLAEAVLGREEQTIQEFLVATSILEVLTPALCWAVTGVTSAAQVLDQIYHRNLFLIGLDGLNTIEQASYRYHDLFRTFLQERLQREAPETLRTWHRRAALASDRTAAKIHHFLQAEEWELAAEVIEQTGRRTLNEGAWQQLIVWIKRLPAALVDARPHLQYLLGVIATARWDLVQAIVHLQRAVDQWEAEVEPTSSSEIGSESAGEGLGEALVALAVAHNLMGDAATAATITERNLAMPISVTNRILLLAGRVWQRTMANDADQVRVDLAQAMDLIEAHRDRQGMVYLASGLRSPVLMLSGLELGERFVGIARQLVQPDDITIQAAIVFLEALIAFWRDQWEEVERGCQAVMELSKKVGGFTSIGVEAEARFLQAVQLAIRGNWAQAEQAFTHYFAEIGAELTVQRDWQLGSLACYARACWLNDRFTELQATYRKMQSITNLGNLPFTAILVDEVKALCLLKEGQLNEAQKLMRGVVERRPPLTLLRLFGEVRLTYAYVSLQAGDRSAALQALTPVLEEIERENIPGLLRFQGPVMVAPLLRLTIEKGIHAQLATKLLTQLDPATILPSSTQNSTPLSTLRIPDTGETLTEREIEVLRLIARGDDNPAIAAEMIVSVNTVKSHVAHILAKLGVSSRTAAAIKAKDLGLVK